MDFALDWVGKTSNYQATNSSLSVAGATLAGKLGVIVSGDTMVYHDTDMRFARLDTKTIQQLFPTIRSPRSRGEILSGRAAVSGSMSRLRIDADVAFDDAISGHSRAVAKGGLGVNKGGVFTADQLQVNLLPLRVALARAVAPKLPVGGTVTGSALLNGSSDKQFTVKADVTHSDVTGDSRIVGNVAYAPGVHGTIPWVNADLQMLPLSLATVGLFAPAAGLRGTVAGPVRITGPLHNMVLDATLTTPDSGSVTAHGTADMAARNDPDRSYDIALATHLFNANSVTTKAPRTNVTADATLQGHGTTLETIAAVLAAHIKTSVYDSVTVDSAMLHLSAWIPEYCTSIRLLIARVPHGMASAKGAFGLTQAHSGSMRFTAAIDSLRTLARLLPLDTGVVQPRPGDSE